MGRRRGRVTTAYVLNKAMALLYEKEFPEDVDNNKNDKK